MLDSQRGIYKYTSVADKESLADRFWKRVSKGNASECWLWTGNSDLSISIGNGKKERSNRISWLLTFGSIPKEHSVYQKCNNRLCCNPNHLYLSHNGNEGRDWEHNFWARIQKGGPNECWPWKRGATTPFGYGVYRRAWTKEHGRGKMTGAHRLAYELKNGPIPEGMNVLHHCDNPPCCNPNHLFLGTDADNVHDCISKGRKKWKSGAQHANAKITDEIVREARRLYVPYNRQFGGDALARRFGISPSNMHQIIRGDAWKHISINSHC